MPLPPLWPQGVLPGPAACEIRHDSSLRSAQDTPRFRRAKIIEFTDKGRATVRLALSALGEFEAEIVDHQGESSVRQLRGALLEILDRPAYARRTGSADPAS